VRFEISGRAKREDGRARNFREEEPTIAWFKDPAGNILLVLEAA